MGLKEKIELRKITEKDIPYLYELLTERDSSITITQKQSPTMIEHVNFVKNQIASISGDKTKIIQENMDPYNGWYVITSEFDDLGSIWIEDDGNIGLQIQKKFQKIGIGVVAFEIIQKIHKKDRYKTTVSPTNHDSIIFCEKMGFVLDKKNSDRYIYLKNINL